MKRWLGLALLASALGSAGAEATLDGRTLRVDNPAGRWERTFPDALGPLTGPLELGSRVLLGVGPVVYDLGAGGVVAGRADLPGTVTSLDGSGGVVRVSTELGDLTERLTLEVTPALSVQERVVFPPDPEVTGWLARAADAVLPGELGRAAAADPLNPFLAVREAEAARADAYAALSAVRRALSVTLPFPAWVALAARLDGAGFPAAADLALDRARRDAAARGVDPAIAVSREALGAYGNPSGYVATLLDQRRLARAAVWMAYLRELHPRFEGGTALYARYAQALQDQGRDGEAGEWRQFSRSLRAGTLYNLGPEGLGGVRDAARLAMLALGAALLAGLLAVAVRAWRAQGQDTRALGGRYRSWLRHPLSRARRVFVAYATLPERLTLVLLAAALLAVTGGLQWVNVAGAGLQSPALTGGTYGGGWGGTQLANLPLRPGPDAALLAGLSAQLDGEDALAREQYTRAGADACARNNLGVIAQTRGDEPQARELYRAALAARPDLEAAAFNLGLNPGTPEAAFQRAYRPGTPRLCYPDQRRLTRAVTGDLSVTLRAGLSRPLTLLDDSSAGSPRLGLALLGAALLSGLLALALLLPASALAPAQARPLIYRALGLLLPGSALLDSPWGSMLLLAWGALVAALSVSSGLILTPSLPALTLPTTQTALVTGLVLTYSLNLLAFIAAEVRHGRRLRREAAA
ncbi:hypothetical protein GO986_19880 [Deinococcus sp. HMF7620]|uniref:Tetratricopeptide repeat protein n=1 Tax=Deinococcus arboris TaxID=2682977 RepID=A0A7C9MBB2_9DEIO|nr:hypothetical protein [Deinococcus arboris]MVN89003.1 hypothetical protein [Deinococcus arboris]